MAFEIPSIVRITPELGIHLDWVNCAAVPEGKLLAITTMGYLHLGQKEFVLCLRQVSDENIYSAINLFQLILQQAQQKQFVDVNGLTQLGSAGIFENANNQEHSRPI